MVRLLRSAAFIPALVLAAFIALPSAHADAPAVTIALSGPATVTAGETVQYTITLTSTNPGPLLGESVAWNANGGAGLLAHTTFLNSDQYNCHEDGAAGTPTVVHCDRINIGPNQAISFHFSVKVKDDAPCGTSIDAIIDLNSTITNPPSQPTWSNNIHSSVNCVAQTVDLAIAKTGPSTATSGQQLSYTITVTNNGQAAATNVVVTDPVPAGLTFVQAGSDASCVLQGSNVVCTGQSLPGGQQKQLILNFQQMSTTSLTCNNGTASISNTATVTSATQDSNTSNNTSQAVVTSLSCGQPDLTITKTGPSTVSPGQTISYTITVANAGQLAAQNIVVTDNIPSGLTFVQAGSDASCVLQNNSVVCTGQSLPAGQSKQLILNFQQTSTTSLTCNNGTASISNTASVTSSTQESNTGNNTSQAVVTSVSCGQPDLTITKSGPSGATAGQQLTYTITVSNVGQATAQNITVTDTVPNGLTFISSGSDTSCSLQGSNVVCTGQSLPGGQSKTLVLNFQSQQNCGNGAGSSVSVTNTASVTSSTQESNTGNNTSQVVTTTLQCPVTNPVFTITKTDNQTTAYPGDVLNYNITVTNASSAQANNVTVTDVLPGQLSFVAASNAGQVNGQTVAWTFSMGPNESRTVSVQARVASLTSSAVITNTANVGNISASDSTAIVVQNNNTNQTTNNTGYQTAIQSNTSTVNVPIQGDNNNVNVSTLQQNLNYQYQQQIAAGPTLLPHTGASDATDPLESTRELLFPLSAATSSHSNPMLPVVGWASVIITGLGAGVRLGRRFL